MQLPFFCCTPCVKLKYKNNLTHATEKIVTMDLFALMLIRTNSCSTFAERSNFDTIFSKFYGRDSGLGIRASFDMLANKNILPHKVLNIVYAQMFTEERNTSEEEEDIAFVPFLHASLQRILETPLYFVRG